MNLTVLKFFASKNTKGKSVAPVRAPLLHYHRVEENIPPEKGVSPEVFAAQMEYLRKKNYHSIAFDDLAEYFLIGRPLPTRPLIISFDDGHLDNWVYAFPLLKKYRVKATIFVITSWMTDGERRNHWQGEDGVQSLPAIPTHKEAKKKAVSGDFSVGLRWEEAQTMEASGLVDIQSHTHWHRDYFLMDGKISRLNPEKRGLLVEDLTRSKELIEKRLGKECNFLSWPWGKYDPEAIVTTEKGVNFLGSSEMTIKRIVAKSGDSWFSQRLRIYSHRIIGHIYSRITGKI